MIVKTHHSNKFRIRESLILPRLIKVLENISVVIILTNGTKVVGTVESYGRKVKTISFKTAISELKLSNKLFGDLNDYLLEGERLKQINKYYKIDTTNTDDIHNNFKIIGDFKSFVLLRDSKIEFNCKIVEVSHISIPESHIATITITGINQHNSLKNSNTDCNNNISKINITKMIIDSYKNEIKNEAFLRCDRIGRNNVKH